MGADAVQYRLIKFLVFICIFCASCTKPVYHTYNISDGLLIPDSTEVLNPIDKNGIVYGITKSEIFFIDINDDRRKDKIIRERFSTGTAHGYTNYKIELDNGEKIGEFKTFEGADCFLTAYKFQFNPFIITKVSRPLGGESWNQPAQSKIEQFEILDDKLEKISETDGPSICDVRELLNK